MVRYSHDSWMVVVAAEQVSAEQVTDLSLAIKPPVGENSNPPMRRIFAAALHIPLLSGCGAPGPELAFLTRS